MTDEERHAEFYAALSDMRDLIHRLTEYAGSALTAPLHAQIDQVADAAFDLVGRTQGREDEMVHAIATQQEELVDARGRAAFLSIAVDKAVEALDSADELEVALHPMHDFLVRVREWAHGGATDEMPDVP